MMRSDTAAMPPVNRRESDAERAGAEELFREITE